jgi:CheY-like chemotaxis protein
MSAITGAQLDPELGLRVEALSRECRGLSTNWNRERVENLYEEAEALAERAQASELTDMSESVLGLAAYLSSFADSAMRPNAAQVQQLQALAEAVADSLQRYRARIEVTVLAPDRAGPLPLRPAIHYLGTNSAQGDVLRTHLALLGYDLAACMEVHDIEQALEAGSALAIVIGAECLDLWLNERRTGIDDGVATRVPLVVLSDRDDIDVRLAAMRCQAESMFVLPEDANRIAPRLASMIADRSEPYRVLIVDDDNSMRLFCSSVLRHNHMETNAVGTPEEALHALHDFTPDVILADLYMPNISGFELLALFRAHPRTAFTPVVLLSGDADMEKRFAALHIGGDDYLTKPIRPRHLVAAVTNRARRARWMRREMLGAR